MRGCALAQADRQFAATAGACFGGLDVNPSGILGEMWMKTAESLMNIGPQSLLEFVDGKTTGAALTLQEATGWMMDAWGSLLNDPSWHASWTMDVQGKWLNALSIMSKRLPDPRVRGVV
jgi:hypothetical protein